MKYTVVIDGEFPTLNEFIDANRIRRGSWSKGNQMKRDNQDLINLSLRSQLRGAHIDDPVHLTYRFYCSNRRKDKDNICGYFHKIFQDSLVESQIINNDSWKYITGFKDEFFFDKESPRIEVEIESQGGN